MDFSDTMESIKIPLVDTVLKRAEEYQKYVKFRWNEEFNIIQASLLLSFIIKAALLYNVSEVVSLLQNLSTDVYIQ